MKKWLFSIEGKITGPLTEVDAKKFVADNLEAYAWHPTYSHWMPVNCVKEFEELVPAPKPPSIIPKELIEEYIGKERAIVARLAKLDSVLVETDTEMVELHEEIVTFKKYTQNSNAELQATLRAIEEQFASLSKNLSGFKAKAKSGKEELASAKKEFDESLAKDNQSVTLKETADFLAKAETQAEQNKAQQVVDEKAKEVVQEKLVAEEKRKAEAAEKAKLELDAKNKANVAAEKAKAEAAAAEKSRLLAEEKAKAEEKAFVEAKAKEKAEAEEKARLEAKAKAEAKEKAKREAEEKAIALKFKQVVEPKAKPQKATVTKIEFSDSPSPEDILLASQLKPLEKPITPDTPEVTEPISKVVGEFDHILYESLDEPVDVDMDDKAKKRLRRRRRR